MDTSKELRKMIKGLKMGIYFTDKLEEKINTNIHQDLKEMKKVFNRQLKILYDDAASHDSRISHDTTNIPLMGKCMIDMKSMFIKSETMIKREAVQILVMGAYQSELFLKKHPHLEDNIKSEIREIINQYYELIKRLNT